jgi:hypothetical protein
MNQITETQNASGSIDPLAQLVVDELRKSGTRAWLRGPSAEERELFGTEKAERDCQTIKLRADARARHLPDYWNAFVS